MKLKKGSWIFAVAFLFILAAPIQAATGWVWNATTLASILVMMASGAIVVAMLYATCYHSELNEGPQHHAKGGEGQRTATVTHTNFSAGQQNNKAS